MSLHTDFTVITIHTAKCDICNNRNEDVLQRCNQCGWSICVPCFQTRGSDATHSINGGDAGWTAERALPTAHEDRQRPRAGTAVGRIETQVASATRRVNRQHEEEDMRLAISEGENESENDESLTAQHVQPRRRRRTLQQGRRYPSQDPESEIEDALKPPSPVTFEQSPVDFSVESVSLQRLRTFMAGVQTMPPNESTEQNTSGPDLAATPDDILEQQHEASAEANPSEGGSPLLGLGSPSPGEGPQSIGSDQSGEQQSLEADPGWHAESSYQSASPANASRRKREDSPPAATERPPVAGRLMTLHGDTFRYQDQNGKRRKIKIRGGRESSLSIALDDEEEEEEAEDEEEEEEEAMETAGE